MNKLVEKTYSTAELFYFTSRIQAPRFSKASSLYRIAVNTPFMLDKKYGATSDIADSVIRICAATPFMEDVRHTIYTDILVDKPELVAVMIKMHNELQEHLNVLITASEAEFPIPLNDATLHTFLDMLSIYKAYYIPMLLDTFYNSSKSKEAQDLIEAKETEKK